MLLSVRAHARPGEGDLRGSKPGVQPPAVFPRGLDMELGGETLAAAYAGERIQTGDSTLLLDRRLREPDKPVNRGGSGPVPVLAPRPGNLPVGARSPVGEPP